jgi:chromosome segregation protein
MFLKRLTMKGFKSFADNTALEFEPGVTAVVGPNGSGKSNVVDAVTWVLGAQSTRALRSAKMEDVIFAGTAGRAALGRAEVTLTLDNASGRLPVDGAEVTISRTLFRNSGESEYAINGTPCRLLDVQELLADSGVGRQQHMIIGQGQLDSVLNSRPEERRAVIEEAAGVLKHRRRKERAERRLATTQENLERLGDLVREVRRQMRPLERQAVAARSYADVDADLRSARRYSFSTRLDALSVRQVELDRELRDASSAERDVRHELVSLDAASSAAAADMASRREEALAGSLGRLQGLAERARGLESLIGERRRSLRAALAASADENVVATLEADAARLASEIELLGGEDLALDALRVELDEARASFADADAHHKATWGEPVEATAEADLRAARESVEVLERSRDRSRDAFEMAIVRSRAGERRHDDALARRIAMGEGRTGALERRDEARAARESADSELRESESRRSEADAHARERRDVAARARARADALERAFDEISGASSRTRLVGLAGVLGGFLELIDVDPGTERALEAGAGAAAAAVVVDGRPSAREVLKTLRAEGGAGLVLAPGDDDGVLAETPARCRALREMVRPRRGAPAHVARVLDALFARTVVAEDFDHAIEVAIAHPDLVVVTREGDRFAASGWRVSSGQSVVTRATVEAAAAEATSAEQALAPAADGLAGADEAVLRRRRELESAIDRAVGAQSELDAVERELVRTDDDLATLAVLNAELGTECANLAAELAAVENELRERANELPSLEAALAEAGQRALWATEARATLDAHRDQVADAASALSAREAELAARRELLVARHDEVERRLEGHGVERAAAAARREGLEADLVVLDRLEGLVRTAADDVREAQDALSASYREQLEASRAGAERLEELRRARALAEGRLAGIADAARRAEVEHAENAVMVANLHESIRRDLGEEPDAIAGAEAPELADGISIEARVAELEARISSLGPINPLALEELTALEDRYKELDGQVSDVRHARRELLEIVRTLDEEIMTTFTAAAADVNEHFSSLISMLFPGGQGRLILTEPDDPLNTGVEIEVRPMGRNVRRISLLSGGERSMAALAFLFAVFRSRPSPFYMMDEVEAALDDVNLQRFLSLVDEFRDEAQLLIVTHQKRTMESADALYGVTIAPGGSSKVVSQRVDRDKVVEPA